MIHDDYTREYDERMKRREIKSLLLLVTKTADRLGCQLLVADNVQMLALMPSGPSLFAEFNTLENAAKWCREKFPI